MSYTVEEMISVGIVVFLFTCFFIVALMAWFEERESNKIRRMTDDYEKKVSDKYDEILEEEKRLFNELYNMRNEVNSVKYRFTNFRELDDRVSVLRKELDELKEELCNWRK